MNAKNESYIAADEALVKLWGKPLRKRDAEICQALGWAEVDPDYPAAYRLADDANPLQGPLHVDGQPIEFRCDDALLEYVLNRQLVCLDRFFGRGTGHRLKLRTLLNLFKLTLDGRAECLRSRTCAFFVATDKFKGLTRDTDGRPWLKEALVAGDYVILVDEGEEVVVPTPRGVFRNLDEADIDGLGLRQVVEELAKGGYLILDDKDPLKPLWRVTELGRSAGLEAINVPAHVPLDRLGLGHLIG